MTSTRPGSPARLARNASSARSSGNDGPTRLAELELAGADEVEQPRQRHRRILGAVDRPGQRLLAVRELERVELELLAAGRQADDDGGAAAARPAERELRRRGRADRIEGIVDSFGVETSSTASRRSSGAQARVAPESERLLAPRLDRVDDEDLLRTGDPRTLNDELAHPAGADHERREARAPAARR